MEVYHRECPNCGREYDTTSMMSKYCNLRCKNAAGLKRRRLREAGMLSITEGRPAAIMSRKQIHDAADAINARKAAEAPAEDILPEEVRVPLDTTGGNPAFGEALRSTGYAPNVTAPQCIYCGERHFKGECKFAEGNEKGNFPS